MVKIVLDLDGTITLDDPSLPYKEKRPNNEVVNMMRSYKTAGFTIAIMTARNMKSFNGNIGLINKNTLPDAIEWLNKHNIPFDEIYVGKPWCGESGFYVDDKAIRPDEFSSKSYEEIKIILKIK
jgi:capsule biosynthesis phosphatase